MKHHLITALKQVIANSPFPTMEEFEDWVNNTTPNVETEIKDSWVKQPFKAEATLIAALKQVVTSKIPNWKQLVVDSFLEFLKKKYAFTDKVDLKIGKESLKKQFGGADFSAFFLKGKYKIRVNDAMLPVLLSRIGHEFLHLVQFRDKDLDLDEKNKMLLWEGNPYMTIMEYKKTTNYEKYKKIPWEAAAIEAGTQLRDEYIKSKDFEKLKESKDPSLRYIIDNDLLLL